MKKIQTVLLGTFVLIQMLACNRNTQEVEMDLIKNRALDSTAVANEKEPSLPERRFIRSASLKSKVRSVSEAVSEIETRTRSFGGWVSYSHFVNTIQDSTGVAVSQDSGLQIMHCSRTAYLSLRIPDYRMDSLVAALEPLSTLMVNREIRADDVSISMLAAQLSRRRSSTAGTRLAEDIRRKGKKLSEIVGAENTLEEKQVSADEAEISNLRMEDSVQYSTITMEIYQDPGILYAEIPKERIVTAYQKPFFSQIGESFSYSWQLLKDILIALSRYWVILLLIIPGYSFFSKQFQLKKKIKAT